MTAGLGPGSSASLPARPNAAQSGPAAPSGAPGTQDTPVAGGEGSEAREGLSEAQRIELIRIAAEMQDMANTGITRHYASRIRMALGLPGSCACFACVPVTPRGDA